jgi:hypothetical protein
LSPEAQAPRQPVPESRWRPGHDHDHSCTPSASDARPNSLKLSE